MTPLGAALVLWVAWTLATWLLEGLPRTLQRPEATGLRLAYALVANLGMGLGVAALVARQLMRRGALTANAAGFGHISRTALAPVVGVVAGAVLYAVQGAPVTDATVPANAFAQVLTVSAAETVVCWSVVGVTSALVAGDRIASYGPPNPAVLATAAVTIAVVLAVYRAVRRPSPSR